MKKKVEDIEIVLSKTPIIPAQLGDYTAYVGGTVFWLTKITVSRLTLPNKTVSFSEVARGWTSFKSWFQEDGVSLNNEYYTFKQGDIWKHHSNEIRNNFYGQQYDSSVQVLFNEAPGIVKCFQTLNYEGSQSKITRDVDSNAELWDNELKEGWYVSQMYTDLQEGELQEFEDKEGKWFSQIKGVATEWLNDGTAGNIDTNEFSYQGIDEAEAISIISGGYTSWECKLREDIFGKECEESNRPWSGQTFTDGTPASGGIPAVPAYTYNDWYWELVNQNVRFDAYKHITTNTNVMAVMEASPTWTGGCAYVNGVDNSAGIWFHTGDHYATTSVMVPSVYPNAPGGPFAQGDTIPPTGLFRTIEEMLEWYNTNVDSTAFYIGMSEKQFVDALAGATGITEQGFSFYGGIPANVCDCADLTSNYHCVEVEGLLGYPTKEICENDTDTPCGPPDDAATYNCCQEEIGCGDEYVIDQETCYDPGDGSGTFTGAFALDKCLEECKKCETFPVQVTTTDATTALATTSSDTPCNQDGSVTVGAATTAPTWTMKIYEYDVLSGIQALVYDDLQIYPAGVTSTIYNTLQTGGYAIVVTDTYGCKVTHPFQIVCLNVNPNCETTGPYNSAAGTGTSPHHVVLNAINASAPHCNNGVLNATVYQLGGGATSFTVEWFTTVGFQPVSIFNDTTVYNVLPATTFSVTNLDTGLYRCKVTDDLGCIYNYTKLITCPTSPQECFIPSHGLQSPHILNVSILAGGNTTPPAGFNDCEYTGTLTVNMTGFWGTGYTTPYNYLGATTWEVSFYEYNVPNWHQQTPFDTFGPYTGNTSSMAWIAPFSGGSFSAGANQGYYGIGIKDDKGCEYFFGPYYIPCATQEPQYYDCDPTTNTCYAVSYVTPYTNQTTCENDCNEYNCQEVDNQLGTCLLYTSPSPRDS